MSPDAGAAADPVAADPGAELVDWVLAARVAGLLADREAPLPVYVQAAMAADFEELTAEAEALVAEETGLHSLAGPARARLLDRRGWVEANVSSFGRLMRPLAHKLAGAPGRLPRLPVGVSSRVAGTQLGLLLGWMSGRVLGQYDQLLVDDDHPEDQDLVYYVAPNVVALERRHGFPPREFRLWLALHEVTHRAQFTAVPWMRGHFLHLVGDTIEGLDPDPARLLEALRRATDAVRHGRNPLDDGGLLALLASPEQRRAIERIGGLMSLLEGHGDITMNRAAVGRIPNAELFHRVLHERRRRQGLGKAISSVVGLEAKLRQYAEGERFIEAVEAAGGPDLFRRVWQSPEWLPDTAEIRSPARWIERAGPVSART